MTRLTKGDLGQSENINTKKAITWKALLASQGDVTVTNKIRESIESDYKVRMRERGFSEANITARVTADATKINEVAAARLKIVKNYVNSTSRPPAGSLGTVGGVAVPVDDFSVLDLPV